MRYATTQDTSCMGTVKRETSKIVIAEARNMALMNMGKSGNYLEGNLTKADSQGHGPD